MNPRAFSHRHLPRLVERMDRFNQRHPWSHNDHFHAWILRHLPAQRGGALDVGCGRGELLLRLADHFGSVHGTDRDPTMRATAASLVAHQPAASVGGQQLSELEGPYDLVTMVAVLHHLDEAAALAEVERLLAPGGRFLVVGLARAESAVDWAWDTVSLLTNPLIGLAKHPRAARAGLEDPAYPMADPGTTYAELQRVFAERLPGARLRRRLGFRYTAAWTKPF